MTSGVSVWVPAVAIVYGISLCVVVTGLAERNIVERISPRHATWAEGVAMADGLNRIRLSNPRRAWIVAGLALGIGPLLANDVSPVVAAYDGALLVVLGAVSIVDAWEYRIPDRIVLPAIAATAALTIASSLGVGGLHDRGLHAPSALVGSVVFAALIGVPHVLRPDAMGLGDVKLAVLLGAAIGLHLEDAVTALVSVGWALALASALGLAVAATSWLARSARLGVVPFGPPLSLGAWLVIVAVA